MTEQVFLYRGQSQWLVGLLSLWLFSACSCGPVAKVCESDSICAKGEICKEGLCVAGCRMQGECAGKTVCFQGACQTDTCLVGSQRVCAKAEEGSRNVGICSDGRETCVLGGTSWSLCTAVGPQTEVCDRLDNDCDGKIDEGEDGKPLDCECPQPGSIRRCYPGPAGTEAVGSCRIGVQYCRTNNTWGICHDALLPAPEVCDKQDNDCNGKVDDGITCQCEPGDQRSCYSGVNTTIGKGVCKAGKQLCGTDRTWGSCEGQVTATLEEEHGCNGKDDDCDGYIDERADGFGDLEACQTCQNGATQECYSGPSNSITGACKRGTQTCSDGTWGKCIGEIIPKAEECDGVDNDCNGQIDDGLKDCERCKTGDTRACFTVDAGLRNKGECKDGTQTCGGSNGWGPCLGEAKPAVETCDGKDNDCNGQIDEDDPQVGVSCVVPNAKGPCAEGKQACSNGALVCTSTYQPQTEDCTNGKDDDCDGIPDGPPCKCTTGQSRPCYSGPTNTQGKGTCKDGTQACDNGTWGACLGDATPRTETCDNQDNDCDGTIDNGLVRPCFSGTNSQRGKGECKDGMQTCAAGTWGTCVGEALSKPELCDGLDNNCDGQIDEALTRSCYNGGTNTQGKGICKDGMQTCNLGQWGGCIGEILPRQEICNHQDDNCDGQVDEQLTRACYSGPTGTSGVALCKAGSQSCTNGLWGNCVGETIPKTELCNNQDDNCDGNIDEGLTQACYTGSANTKGKGECKDGTQRCGAGIWGSCIDEVLPSSETCDNKDNDCNGQIDDGNVCGSMCMSGQTRPCYTGPNGTSGVGTCKDGTQTCMTGIWTTCNTEVTPATNELCDGKDDNCNGQIDDGTGVGCLIELHKGPKIGNVAIGVRNGAYIGAFTQDGKLFVYDLKQHKKLGETFAYTGGSTSSHTRLHPNTLTGVVYERGNSTLYPFTIDAAFNPSFGMMSITTLNSEFFLDGDYIRQSNTTPITAHFFYLTHDPSNMFGTGYDVGESTDIASSSTLPDAYTSNFWFSSNTINLGTLSLPRMIRGNASGKVLIWGEQTYEYGKIGLATKPSSLQKGVPTNNPGQAPPIVIAGLGNKAFAQVAVSSIMPTGSVFSFNLVRRLFYLDGSLNTSSAAVPVPYTSKTNIVETGFHTVALDHADSYVVFGMAQILVGCSITNGGTSTQAISTCTALKTPTWLTNERIRSVSLSSDGKYVAFTTTTGTNDRAFKLQVK